MSNFLGAKHWLGFKPQATPGTPETTVNTFLSTESIAMNKKHKPIERKTFAGTGRQLPSRVGYFKPDGKATCEVMASQPHLWYWLLGAVTTTTPSAGVHLHTITDGGDGINLTAEADKVFHKAKQGDVKLDKLVLKGAVGEVAHLEVTWLGLTHEDGATLTSTPTFVTDVLTVRSATVKIAGTQDMTVENFEITVDPAVESIATIEDADGAPHTVHRKSPCKVSGKLKFIDFPVGQLAALQAATVFSLVVEIVGDNISGNYDKFLRVTLPAAQYTGGMDGDIAADVITGEADFEGFYDTTSAKQILVEAQNTISSITT